MKCISDFDVCIHSTNVLRKAVKTWYNDTQRYFVK